VNAAWALAVFSLLTPLAQSQDRLDVFAFSTLRPGAALPREWREVTSPRLDRTRYSLVADKGVTVLRAESKAAMSSMSRRVEVDPVRFSRLRWSWKISNLIERSDMRLRSLDDFPARLYVSFDYDISRLPLLERSRLRIARALHGPDVPAAVLCYVWDRQAPAETIASSPYTGRVRIIVATSGAAHVGEWVEVERNLVEDYRNAFGELPDRVNAVALATDTDNTRSEAVSHFSDVVFFAASR
jgi:hypothetical protein